MEDLPALPPRLHRCRNWSTSPRRWKRPPWWPCSIEAAPLTSRNMSVTEAVFLSGDLGQIQERAKEQKSERWSSKIMNRKMKQHQMQVLTLYLQGLYRFILFINFLFTPTFHTIVPWKHPFRKRMGVAKHHVVFLADTESTVGCTEHAGAHHFREGHLLHSGDGL